MKVDSAGILFVHKGECLLAHSTNSRKVGSWMPPKGHLEKGEKPEDAASRETEEEIGWNVDKSLLRDYFYVEYDDKYGDIYKVVKIFVVPLKDKNPDNNGPLINKVSGLQLEEVDEIRWFDIDGVEKMALHRYVKNIKIVLGIFK